MVSINACWGAGLSAGRRHPYGAELNYALHQVWLLRHGTISRLARSAAFNANPPCGTGISYVARIFSMTLSIKKLKIRSSRSRGLDELLIGLNPHDDLWEHVMPA
jgi:hypothetical protein